MAAEPQHGVGRAAAWLVLVVTLAACGGRQPSAETTTGALPATSVTPTTAPPITTTPRPTTTLQEPANTTAPTTTTTTQATTQAPSTTTTTPAPPTVISAPGDHSDALLEIRLTFRSEVPAVSSADFEATAIGILTDSRGWGRSGFTFAVDDSSELTVVLAEPGRVDELCLPLETKGYASCQNGAVVALNAERWRTATGDWDSSIDDYRRYLVTHEVGHLIGLRHPAERCPAGAPLSAVMEPQTGGLVCPGNGWPLDWEIQWANNRPAVVGPLPEWDGPRPTWP